MCPQTLGQLVAAVSDDADITASRDKPSVETLARVSALTTEAGTVAVAALAVAALVAAAKVPLPGAAIWEISSEWGGGGVDFAVAVLTQLPGRMLRGCTPLLTEAPHSIQSFQQCDDICFNCHLGKRHTEGAHSHLTGRALRVDISWTRDEVLQRRPNGSLTMSQPRYSTLMQVGIVVALFYHGYSLIAS
jgi:hypothetical protein